MPEPDGPGPEEAAPVLLVTADAELSGSLADGLDLETSAADALERAREKHFDAVVLDLGAGEVSADGERAVSELAELSAVVVIAGARGAATESLLEAGAQEVILRSEVTPAGLARAVADARARHRHAKALRERVRELETSEARYHEMVEQNADGVVIVAGDGTVRYLNRSAVELFRRGQEELLGQPFGFPVVADGPTQLDIVRRGEAPVVAEMRVARTSWSGDAAYLISLRDITDRKQAEERERELASEQAARAEAEAAERRYRFLAHAGEILDSSLDYNQTLRLLAGLLTEELSDWCVIDLIEPDDAPRRICSESDEPEKEELLRRLEREVPLDPESDQPAAQALRTGRVLHIEEFDEDMLARGVRDAAHLEILRELGTASVIAAPLRARGRTLGVITLVSSTPEDRYSAADADLVGELARRAAISVDNVRLYRDAQLANRAKSDFLAVMSHELRTPLNSIIGYVELVTAGITGPLNEKQMEQLGKVKVSSSHLLQIIDEILTYSRMEAGRETVRLEEATLGDLLREVGAVAEPLAREKQLDFRITCADEDGTLLTDTGKVRQVLLNLLTNAVKFTDAGEIEVIGEIDGDEVVLRVRDTGRGIAEEDVERIFQPFWQVERPRTRTAGGTGLGLSVSRRLCRLLGGELSLESTIGEGTTFTARIRRRLPDSYTVGPGPGEPAAGEG